MINYQNLIYILLMSLTISGCGPTLKSQFYSPRLHCPKEQTTHHMKSIAILNIDDSRPFSQKVHIPEIVMDTFLIPLSLGTICLFYTKPELNYHAIKNLDKNIPDFLADCLVDSNAFQKITRLDISGSEIIEKMTELNEQGFDYALLGNISNFKGDFQTKVIHKESIDTGVAYKIIKTHNIIFSYGSVVTEWKLLDLKSSREIWEKKYEQRWDEEPNVSRFRRVAENQLAVSALEKTLDHLATDLKGLVIQP